jgi:hypothetical protein
MEHIKILLGAVASRHIKETFVMKPPIEISDIVTDICYECFSKERSVWSFWINKSDQWAKSLPLAGKIMHTELINQMEKELEATGKSYTVVGDMPQDWQCIAFLLIHGYNVQIPCYENIDHKNPNAGQVIGYLSLDNIIATALDWNINRNLDWLYIQEGIYINNLMEDFIHCVLKAKPF